MNSLRKWLYRPRRDDKSLLAKFWWVESSSIFIHIHPYSSISMHIHPYLLICGYIGGFTAKFWSCPYIHVCIYPNLHLHVFIFDRKTSKAVRACDLVVGCDNVFANRWWQPSKSTLLCRWLFCWKQNKQRPMFDAHWHPWQSKMLAATFTIKRQNVQTICFANSVKHSGPMLFNLCLIYFWGQSLFNLCLIYFCWKTKCDFFTCLHSVHRCSPLYRITQSIKHTQDRQTL